MLDFLETYNSLKLRPTETLISLARRLCEVKTINNIITVEAAMLILLDRLDEQEYNALWAHLEDAGFQAGDEADTPTDYTGSIYCSSNY